METKDNLHISHHEVQDKTVFENLHWSRTRRWVPRLEDLHQYPLALSSAGNLAMELSIDAVLEGRESDALDLLRFSHLARLWHWHGMTGDGPHHVRLPGVPDFEAGRMRPNVDVNVPSVLKGIEIAIILRDYPTGCIYRQVNFDAISNFGGVQMEGWMGSFLKSYQAVGESPDNCLQQLRSADSALKEIVAETGKFKTQLALNIPIFDAWGHILSGKDEFGFNGSIRQHLEAWKTFQTESSDQSCMIGGFVSFRALAACCYAHDLGMKITVSSDYIPEFLIRGDFPRVKWPNPEWITE